MGTIVLVPGFWLGAWAWAEVTSRLRAAGHDVYPVTLTGLAERAAEAVPRVNVDTHIADLMGLVRTASLRDVPRWPGSSCTTCRPGTGRCSPARPSWRACSLRSQARTTLSSRAQ
jgi:hypothetical protein